MHCHIPSTKKRTNQTIWKSFSSESFQTKTRTSSFQRQGSSYGIMFERGLVLISDLYSNLALIVLNESILNEGQ